MTTDSLAIEPGVLKAREGPGRRWLIATLVVLLASVVYVVRMRSGMADFGVNYQAGRRLWAGEPLYQTTDGHFMFKYLPSSALLYLPLAALPIEVAKALWYAMSVAALLWSFVLVQQLVPERRVRRLALVPALVLAKYFLRELRLGQINIVVMVVMLLAVRALARPREPRQDRGAGAWAAVATALKPHTALLFPYLIVARRWMSAVWGLGALAATLAVPAIFYGPEGYVRLLRNWASTLAESTPGLLTNVDNVSVVAFFAKWTGDSSVAVRGATVVLGLLAVGMLAVIAGGRRLPKAPVLEGALVLILIPLVSPLGWDYTFLLSLLGVTLLVNYLDVFPSPVRLLLKVNFAMIGLTIYDVMGRHAYATFMQWSVTTVNFLVVVGALMYLRIKRVC